MRGPRISFPGAYVHAINRFVDKHPFFRSPDDYALFLQEMRRAANAFAIEILAYVIMPNHFHLLLRTGSGELSRFFCRFLSAVARRLNKRYQRTGHLFQGRTRSFIIQDERYFLTALRYVLLNPVRAGLASGIYDYPWSSAREMVGRSMHIDRPALLIALGMPVAVGGSGIFRRLSEISADDSARQYAEARRGGFIAEERYRKEVLQKTERRRENRVGERRKADRLATDTNLAELEAAIHAAISCVKLVPPWRNRNIFRRDALWYIAYRFYGWKLSRLRSEAGEPGVALSKYAMAIRRIDGDARKLAYMRAIAKCLKLPQL